MGKGFGKGLHDVRYTILERVGTMPGSREGVTQNGVQKKQGRAIPRWEIDCRNSKKNPVKIGEE